MNIGKAAAKTGVSAKRNSYYEQIGPLGEAKRSAAGYRLYDHRDLHALNFNQRARRLGFAVPQIAALLELWHDQDRSSATVKHLVEKHISELQEKIDELQAMADTLNHLADRCEGDSRPDCPIIEDLERRNS